MFLLFIFFRVVFYFSLFNKFACFIVVHIYLFAKFERFQMSEIAVGSLFRVVGGALAGGVLLRVPGIHRGRMVPWFLYLSGGGGCAEKHGFCRSFT